ncbi:MAG TPA: transglycosylase family protein [Acidimicrobiales bacterium]|nr:transglycosylase family protein [Acidimicrobiales bacterium]
MKRALISAAITAAAVTLSSAPAWAAPASSQVVLPGQATYHVVPGDSYWSVSQHYGVTMQDLAAWNHQNLWAPLDAGWTLQIPPAGWHAASAAPVTTDSSYASSSYQAPSTRTYSSGTSGSSGYGSAPSGIWGCIAQHESGANPAANTGNGYYGMYQFTLGTWRAAGGTGNPADASAAEQTAVAQRVQQQQGWGAWPTTSRICGA